MRAWISILVLAATGCTENAEYFDWEDEPFFNWEDAPWELEWSEYTRIQDLNEARLWKEGPPMGSGEVPYAMELESLPVIEKGVSMRVLVQAYDIAFLAWVDDSNALDLVTRTTWGSANPEQIGEAGALFLSGTPVEFLSDDAQVEHVEYFGEGFELESWMTPGSIQPFFEGNPEPRMPTEGDPILLLDGADLLDAPNGEVFGTINVNSTTRQRTGYLANGDIKTWPARVLGPETAGHQLVEIGEMESPVQVRAWVNLEEVHTINDGLGMFGTGYGSSCGCGFSAPDNVLKGTLLYDEMNGEVVGWVVRDRNIPLKHIDSNWARGLISWQFPGSEVWIRTSELVEPVEPRDSPFFGMSDSRGSASLNWTLQ